GAVEKGPLSSQMKMAVVEDRGRIAYDGLTLLAPKEGYELLKNLTVDIPRGTRVLVVGPNESARVGLFLATAGIWPRATGTIVRPPLDDLLFVPQRAYLPPGSLRDVLLHDGQGKIISDEQIVTALKDAGLEAILRVGGLDTEND